MKLKYVVWEKKSRQRRTDMKIGFILVALLATWLTLNYPDLMREYFNKVVTYMESVTTFITK